MKYSLLIAEVMAAAHATQRPQAMIYRGPAACDGCPESVAHVLETSVSNFEVTYAGPDEDVQISAETLAGMDVFVQPGGPDLDRTWPMMKPYAEAVRGFVANGGTFLGFCLGAYMAGSWDLEDDGDVTHGYELLPKGTMTVEECEQDDAQVTDTEDTVIQVDWTFTTGPDAGEKSKRWLYFQDGAAIEFKGDAATANGGKILGVYSSSGDIAATVTPYGNGSVGVVGPHPEATKDWYTPYHIKNPDGYNLSVAYDFVEATYQFNKS